MPQFSYYIDNDWFKIGRYGEKHVRYINIGLLGNLALNPSNFQHFPIFFTILYCYLFFN